MISLRRSLRISSRCIATFPRCQPDSVARPFNVMAANAFSARKNASVAEKEPGYVTGKLTGYNLCRHGAYKLLSGVELKELDIAYETWGELNPRRDNAILLQCGMSASSHAASQPKNKSPGWWEEFIGPGRSLDTNLFYVICTNNLGGCYGTTGPSSVNPDTGKPYGSRFPRFDLQDMVSVQFALLDHLGISRVHACVGASLGGMLSVCSAASYADRVGKFVSISACAKSFAGTIAFRHSQRQAVMSDPNWNGGDYYEGELPAVGLRLARQIGTMTYRSGLEWSQREFHERKGVAKKEFGMDHEFEIEHYLVHQGEKWVNNYDPNSLLWISKAMDGFTMEKLGTDGKPSLVEGLKTAMQPALVIGVQHDVLFPVWQQKEIADSLKAAGNSRVAYYELDSVYGHDAFLLESHSIGPAIKGHLEQEPGGALHLWQDLADTAVRLVNASNMRANQADFLRDIFRSQCKGSDTVTCDQLRHTMKFVTEIDGDVLDSVFEKRFVDRHDVTLNEFLEILPDVQAARYGQVESDLGGM